MSLIHKQIPESLNTKDYTKNSLNNPFKHFIKCTSCLWNITFYEATGRIPLNSKKIRCPICKEKEMRSFKIKIIS